MKEIVYNLDRSFLILSNLLVQDRYSLMKLQKIDKIVEETIQQKKHCVPNIVKYRVPLKNIYERLHF